MLEHPRQIAYAVQDVRAAAEQWIARGVGPFFLNEHIEVGNSRVFGEPAEFDHSSAYAQWGDVMVELICQHNPGPTPLVGPSGLHHVAFFVDDFDEASQQLTAQEFPEVLYGEAGSMPFGMFDARGELGHLVEIYPGTDRLKAFYALVQQAAANWDGSDPIRSPSS